MNRNALPVWFPSRWLKASAMPALPVAVLCLKPGAAQLDYIPAQRDGLRAKPVRDSSGCACVSSERGFVSSESGGVSSERDLVSTESSRVSSEWAYVSSESGRVSSEPTCVTSEHGFVSSKSACVTRTRRLIARTRTLFGFALLACLPAAALADAGQHVFTLHGGHFFGPGPIVPDTALPDGSIRNISFDLAKLEGVAAFAEGGKVLSDGKTVSNANIDAGALEIGGKQDALKGETKGKTEGKTFWLYAVAGGPNGGRETYRFDAHYNMVWTVDIGLDPGFAEGILRVNGFELTTGVRKVPLSMQSATGKPGGYDKAGSYKSGALLVGRVGDFDSDGFMDGIIVASANVPLQADLLPGAPVANKRGFSTDVPIDPLFAMELTLHGIANMRHLVKDTLNGGHLDQLTEYLKDVQERLLAARGNYEAAFIKTPPGKRAELQELEWRLESIKQMIYIPVAFLTTYNFPSGNAPWTVGDATARAFDKAEALAALLEKRRGGHAPAAIKPVSTKSGSAKK